MSIILNKSNGINGEITVPGDKSISHRAVIFGSIANGITSVRGFLAGEDNLRTVNAFKMMGVNIRAKDDTLTINGVGLRGLKEPDDVIYAGNSGTTARLLLGLLSRQPFFSALTGDEYLRKRPMKRIVEPLRRFGAHFTGRNGGANLPICVSPGGAPAPVTYDMTIASAQLKSALMLAGLYSTGENVITEPALSRNHTENMLRAMGVDIKVTGNEIRFDGGQEPSGLDIEVPGDISSAAFFIVAASIVEGSNLLINNVGINPTRTGIIDVLKEMGADISLGNLRESAGEATADITIRSSALRGVDISGDMIPKMIDEFPIISLAAAKATGVTRIRDAAELRVKESDRIMTTADSLRRLGVEVKEFDDGMDITGAPVLKCDDTAEFDSCGDHRIAMMLCIAAAAASTPLKINDIQCINTSFPDFLDILESFK